jgi:uncharacterized protein (TIGR02996 family)
VDEAAFLAAIRAAPGDPTPRLIYADWLDDRGDPRAEFVRLQHQLAEALDRLQRLRSALDREWVQAVEVRRDVVVHGFDPRRRPAVLKLVRLHSGLGLEQARELLARLPAAVFPDLPLERAERLRQELAEVAAVTIEPPGLGSGCSAPPAAADPARGIASPDS